MARICGWRIVDSEMRKAGTVFKLAIDLFCPVDGGAGNVSATSFSTHRNGDTEKSSTVYKQGDGPV